MKVGYNWLKTYVDIDVAPEDLAKDLTMSGSEVESIESVGDEKVLTMEITSNRPDCLNVIGIAREVSAIYDRDLGLPDMAAPGAEEPGPEIRCIVRDERKCPMYTARVLTGVEVGPAGDEIRKPIESLGMRSVNNVVDVTNFCLMETGQPMHAFDLDKIAGGTIIVREAEKGEKITTIDDVERELEKGMLVIADAERPVAIAGIMGGKDTEVTDSTTNVVLESAYFDPLSVRRTARRLGISTDSSYRFERGVDKGMILSASSRAVSILRREAGAVPGRLYRAGGLPADSTSVKFDMRKAGKILGIELEEGRVEAILIRLGLSVTGKEGSVLEMKVPSFREDLKRPVDLTEEVARILGYHNIPARVDKLVPQIKRKNRGRQVQEKVRSVMWGAGLSEIMTYSLVGREAAEMFPQLSADPVYLENPLSEEHQLLTPHLIHGMLKSISWNLNRQNRDIRLFETGTAYSAAGDGKGYNEKPLLCVGLTGSIRNNWQEGAREADLFHLRGVVDLLFDRLQIRPLVKPAELEGFDAAMRIFAAEQDTPAGIAGSVNRKVLNAYDIEDPVFICQIELGELFRKAVLEHRYTGVPRFPFSARDISLLCGDNVQAQQLEDTILESGEDIIRDVRLIDIYEGENIPEGKKSYTYSIKYGLGTRTLRDEEVDSVHSRLKKTLIERFDISFR
jgi:phenylalanyl-tRNA synthetase beta chain